MDSIKVFFSFIGTLISYTLDFLFFILIRLVFDINVIGQYGVIFSFLLLFSFVLALGIETTYIVILSKAKTSDEEKKCNGAFLFYRFIQFIIYTFLVFTFFYIIPIFNVNIIVFLFFFLGNLLDFTAIHIFEFILLSKKQIFKKNLISALMKFLKVLLLILFGSILRSTISLLALINFISSLFFFTIGAIFIKDLKVDIPDMEMLKRFLKLSYPFVISTSILIIFRNIDLLLINIWFSIEEVANFFTAKQIFEVFISISLNMSLLLLMIFSHNVKLGRIEQNLIITRKIHKILNFFAVLFVFLSILYSTELILIIFGESYKMTGLLLSIYLLNLIVISIDLGNKAQIRALDEVKFLAIITISQNLLSLGLLLVFISPKILNMGAFGGALSSITATVIAQIIFRPVIYKKFGISFYWGFFRNFFIMLGVFIVQIYINNVINYTIIFIPLFILLDTLLYFFINYLCKGISKENIQFIKSVLSYKNIKSTIYTELNLS